MLGYFPNPLPDELFVSVIARFAYHVGMPDAVALMQELTTTYTPSVDICMANDVRHLIANLPPGHTLTVEEVLEQHTLLPLFGAVLPVGATKALRAWMAGSTGSSECPLYWTTDLNPWPLNPRKPILLEPARRHVLRGYRLPYDRGLPHVRYLRYCPLCAADDLHTYGEYYWHRLHHIRGIDLCATHGVWLRVSVLNGPPRTRSVSYTNIVSGVIDRMLLGAAGIDMSDANPVDLRAPGARLQLQLLEDINWLLAQSSRQTPLLFLRERALDVAFQHRLVERGSRRLQVSRLRSTATALFEGSGQTVPGSSRDRELLDLTRKFQDDQWWRHLIARQRAIGDALPWLVMIRAAGYSTEELLSPRSLVIS